ncbi:MAG: pantoate--beta-alanine ligase [Moraxellaceae bacterium]|nr:pantoate--beta-alanine ligase [Moraxellaceae bacterium]MBP8851502.1 pantoate--beta-alanine ligase [Moraxellaceae bacterium]MBP9044900.1 pantoate--beta-alanine ligase [Moraxellaceae bacterium]MBP9730249.1 pantoate--beta-alanine ligase [Moraxellaceae bacterium]MCC6200438.1 pantoate--beta-alanine ligase [Moraxellaceae bacterium]
MKTETTITGLRSALRAARKAGKSIAFVPTMGNLHDGHITLIKAAKRHADIVVASIFVNPTQFGANEDFDTYPRTLAADSALLADAQCDVLFAPDAREMYPDGRTQLTTVCVSGITDILCGASRPGHFTGVATVVSKLFNIVQPDIALFGEKDFQQLAVIRCLARELCFSTEVIGVPTVRADDGLALSSRNGFLTASERQRAPILHQTLSNLHQAIINGQRNYDMLAQAAMGHLSKCGFVPDYLDIRRQDLAVAGPDDKALVILVAAKLGSTRLIDNLAFELA